jgi:crotonobetainyl-CoA:carnitine CoA-transferase CaiB-like acyl-CoA transferase
MAGILDGIRVVEFSAILQGPVAGLVLTQLGADVIRIEDPIGKDRSRFNRAARQPMFPQDKVPISAFTNRNKKAITIDLANEKGREIAYRLIAKADVFLSNYIPKSLKELGLDYETLSGINPRLVYASSSSYGKKGPESNWRSFDQLAIARSGLMMAAGEAGAPPVEIPGFVGDCMAGSFLAFGIISGLLARERLGIGQEVSTSLIGPLVWAQMVHVTQYLMNGRLAEQPMVRQKRTSVLNPLSNNYCCKDGRWLKMTGMHSDGVWHELCNLLSIEQAEKDTRFVTSRDRQDNNEELIQILDDAFKAKTRDEWIAHFRAKKAAGFLYVAIKEVSELPDDPQLWANNYFVKDEHPEFGNIRMVQLPIDFSKSPVFPGGKSAPQLGEHTEEILTELGYRREEIEEFKIQKIV